jgi:hypothetical protein
MMNLSDYLSIPMLNLSDKLSLTKDFFKNHLTISLWKYLIDASDFDWQKLLENWTEQLPSKFTIWLVNTFGDLFIVLEDGSVHHFATDTGQLEKLAGSRGQFADLIDKGDNVNDWLMILLVDKLISSGQRLELDKCYGYKILPLLGGSYTIDNVAIMSVEEYYPFLGYVYQKLKDLPDGTKIRLETV